MYTLTDAMDEMVFKSYNIQYIYIYMYVYGIYIHIQYMYIYIYLAKL